MIFSVEFISDKKVLLRERKRHTARRVVSTPSVVLPGYPPPGGGTWAGYPPSRGGTWPGYPPGGVPDRVPPLGGGPGTPPGGVRVPPPPRRCLMAFWEMLQSIMGYGYPPPCGQTDGWMEGQTLVKTLPSLVLRTRAVIISYLLLPLLLCNAFSESLVHPVM